MKLITLIAILTCSSTIAFGQKVNKAKGIQEKPFVIGTIEELQSKALGETRVLNIYLPNGYNKDDTTKYSVIYLLDGSADEDFIHITGLTCLALFISRKPVYIWSFILLNNLQIYLKWINFK